MGNKHGDLWLVFLFALVVGWCLLGLRADGQSLFQASPLYSTSPLGENQQYNDCVDCCMSVPGIWESNERIAMCYTACEEDLSRAVWPDDETIPLQEFAECVGTCTDRPDSWIGACIDVCAIAYEEDLIIPKTLTPEPLTVWKLDDVWYKNATTACTMWTDGKTITEIDCPE